MKIYLFVVAAFMAIIAIGCTVQQNVDTGVDANITQNDTDDGDGRPIVYVVDQQPEDSAVLIEQVVSPDDGWIVIHRSEDGQPGEVLGYERISRGVNNDISITLDEEYPGAVIAVIHADNNDSIFIADEDLPIDYQGDMIYMEFNIDSNISTNGTQGSGQQNTSGGENQTNQSSNSGDEALSPDISIIDQEIENGRIIAQRVVSNENGWAVVHLSNNGIPGDVVGYSPVKEGVNERVGIAVDVDVTSDLILMLHVDRGRAQIYEYPGADVPLESDGEIVMEEFRATLPGNAGDLRSERVNIVNFSFQPSELRIERGTTVIWTNRDSVRHTATGDDFDSGLLVQGESYNYTFNEAGTYDYICTPHPSMQGRIIVE